MTYSPDRNSPMPDVETKREGEGRKKALIISISYYKNLQPLEFCQKDGQEMYSLLKDIGYEVKEEHKLIGEINVETLRKTITRFFTDRSLNGKDTLLFYFSGHGVPEGNGETYIASSEMDPDEPYEGGYSFDDLTKMMHRSIAKKVVMILDCCCSGSASLTKGSDDEAANLARVAITRNSERFEEGEGKCLLAASMPGRDAYAFKGKDHSLFTYHLLQGLTGGNGEAVDSDGLVTPYSLGDYVYNKVTKVYPKQRPIIKTESAGRIILAQYPQYAQRRLGKIIIDEDEWNDILNATQRRLGKIIIDEDEWNDLLNAIEDKKCTPFIGPGASSQWIRFDNICRTWVEDQNYPLDDSDDLSKVAQYVAIMKDNALTPKKMLSAELKKINPPDFRLEEFRHTLLAVLADLNLPLYITTNYDQFLEAALESQGKAPITEFCRWSQELKKYVKKAGIPSIFDKRDRISLKEETPIVYHLHGVVEPLQSMVLTERDHMEFVIHINRDDTSYLIPPTIEEALSTNTLLFIGYDIEDEIFHTISAIKYLFNVEYSSNSIVVLVPPSGTEADRQRHHMEVYLRNSLKAKVIWGDAFEFVEELRKRLDEFRSEKSKS